jgi:hypothetical protein
LRLSKYSASQSGPLSTRTQNNIDLIKKLYESGDDNAERHQGTLYGAFQACTNYANHHVVVRGEFADREEGKLSPDGYARRVDSFLFGKGADISAAAMAAATEIMQTPYANL